MGSTSRQHSARRLLAMLLVTLLASAALAIRAEASAPAPLPRLTGTITVTSGTGLTATATLPAPTRSSWAPDGSRSWERYDLSWAVTANYSETVGCLTRSASWTGSVPGVLTVQYRRDTRKQTLRPTFTAIWDERWSMSGTGCGSMSFTVPQYLRPAAVENRAQARAGIAESFSATFDVSGAGDPCAAIPGPGTGCMELGVPLTTRLSQLTMNATLVRGLNPIVPSLRWSMPPRMTPSATGLSYPGPTLDDYPVIKPSTWTVNLDACASDGAERAVLWQWTVAGTTLPESGCRATWSPTTLPTSAVTAKVAVTAPSGAVTSATQSILPKDYLIVSFGDSFGSGEGVPEVGTITGFSNDTQWKHGTWSEDQCDRSSGAGPAQAAYKLEVADPQSSVTFVQLACSGAVSGYFEPGVTPPPGDGGLLRDYDGVVKDSRNEPPQVLAARQIENGTGRQIDAAIVSIGGNDLGFGPVVVDCLTASTSCRDLYGPGTAKKAALDAATAALPGRIGRIRACLTTGPCQVNQFGIDATISPLGIAPANIFVTKYPDVIRTATPTDGLTVCRYDLRSDASISLAIAIPVLAPLIAGWLATSSAGVITADEFRWAESALINPLNQGISAGWGAGVTMVEASAEWSKHGICSDDPWVNTIGASIMQQGVNFSKSPPSPDGAVHPNRAGHLLGYATDIYAAFQARGLAPAGPPP